LGCITIPIRHILSTAFLTRFLKLNQQPALNQKESGNFQKQVQSTFEIVNKNFSTDCEKRRMTIPSRMGKIEEAKSLFEVTDITTMTSGATAGLYFAIGMVEIVEKMNFPE